VSYVIVLSDCLGKSDAEDISDNSRYCHILVTRQLPVIMSQYHSGGSNAVAMNVK
jgi:hypothetical protein